MIMLSDDRGVDPGLPRGGVTDEPEFERAG